MLQNLRNIVVVSLSTVSSRLLGLLRDILIFAALGTSLWNSAFILAFTIPNLFRRMLGEGALTSAIVPIFSEVLERDGRAVAFRFLNQVLLRLFVILLLIIVLGICLLNWVNFSGYLPDRWASCLSLTAWLLPYMLFICLAAILSAVLNLVGRFAIAASTPVLLNFVMIIALSAGLCLETEAARTVHWLCVAVLVGGVLQLLLPTIDLLKQGWRPQFEPKSSEALKELFQLFLPGLMGATVLQINVLVSRLLAYTLEESTVSMLYLASRLMELPLGIFTIAVVTIFFPLLSKAISGGEDKAFSMTFLQGLRLVVGISLPAGVGLCVLGEPIVKFLFLWGDFRQSDVMATIPLLAVYGIGLPFYSVAIFATRGLHANKDMYTPLRVAIYCLFINLLAGLILMQFFGAVGLATANVMAAIAQSYLLWRAISLQQKDINLSALWPAISKIIFAGFIMGLACIIIFYIPVNFVTNEKITAALTVGVIVPIGVCIYLGLLYILRFEELDALKSILSRYLPFLK